jgi:hydrogenase maturation protease
VNQRTNQNKDNKRLLVIGIGNPILRDDSIGLRVVQIISRMKPEVKIIEVTESGIGLLDLIIGYEKLVIIDSIKTGKNAWGHLYRLELADLKPSSNFFSSHGVDIASTIKMGNTFGYKMPMKISIYAIEIKDNTTFSEELTPEVEEKLSGIVAEIVRKEKI